MGKENIDEALLIYSLYGFFRCAFPFFAYETN